MRFLIADALNGACFAAIIVLAAGHTQKVTVGPIAGTAVRAQEGVSGSQPLVQSSAERVLQPAERERNVAGAEGGDRSPVAIETARITAGDNSPKPEAVPVSRLPSFTRREPKAPEGLGAAADGGIDAYVPPIVRQRPVTRSLKSEAKAKEKVKVKSAAPAKSKSQGKQASRTVTPAPVR